MSNGQYTIKKLTVPINIGSFVWLSVSETEDDLYVRVVQQNNLNGSKVVDVQDCTATLLDCNGKPLAIISSLEVIETNVKAVESTIKQQQCTMPDLWEEKWKNRLGTLEHRLDFTQVKNVTTEIPTHIPSEELQQLCKMLMEYSWLSMLRALYECGWQPKKEDIFTTDQLIKQLNIKDEHRLYFGFILDVLEEEGVITQISKKEREVGSRISNCTWQVCNVKYTSAQLLKYLNSPIFTEQLANQFKSTKLLQKLGDSFGDVLLGKQNALSILFPEDKVNKPSVGAFYEEYGQMFGLDDLGGEGLQERMQSFKDAMNGEKFVLRILEIGAGTGAFTGLLLEVLEKLEMEYEYTYTDISKGFFSTAEKKIEKFRKNMKFKTLNVEEDPLSQGFIPEYYDYVCVSEVIHATRDIVESLTNTRLLMRSGGKLDLIETTVVNRYITYLVGLLPGYWRFQDLDLRPSHCTMSKDKWRWALEKTGFGVDNIIDCLMEQNAMICAYKKTDLIIEQLRLPEKTPTWLLFLTNEGESDVVRFLSRKLEQTGRKLLIVELRTDEIAYESQETLHKIYMGSEEQFKLFLQETSARKDSLVEGILYGCTLSKSITDQSQILKPFFFLSKNISLLINGTSGQKHLPRLILLTNGAVAFENCEVPNYHVSTLWGFCRSLRNEMSELIVRCLNILDDNWDNLRQEEIFRELFNVDSQENQIGLIGRTKFIPKFMPYKPSKQEEPLELPRGTDRFQLIHPETRAIADLEFGLLSHFELADDEIEVRVKCFGLNFRDVLNVIKPTEQFYGGDFDTVGFDFAGVVFRLGKNVTKYFVGDRVYGLNMNGTALPSHLKLQEDYVMPVPEHMSMQQAATLPVVYSTAYDCLVTVAKIKPTDTVLIHTASGGVGICAIQICRQFGVKNIIATAGSRRKQNFLRNLGIQHVFNSRDTNYAENILRVTNGRGVDVVLNSLTSKGFKEASLSVCAKDAWFLEMSKISIWTKEEINELRADVKYYVVDVEISSVTPEMWQTRMQCFADGKLNSPLPFISYDATRIKQALGYLQKANHIGKVVCNMPEWTVDNSQRNAEIPMFNDRSSYLITGGLGGIGWLVCQWMIRKGAKYVILIARSPPTDKMQREILKLKNEKDCKLEVCLLDIGNKTQCKTLFDEQIPALNLPSLRGIMHCAGILCDGLVVNQTWERMSCLFNAKVDGTINLHEFTKNQHLEHFVLFSSIAGLFGPPGISNHAAVCNFEDTFAYYRHSIGLPATTINWGQWGEVGVATEQDFPGIRPISNLQGITALEHAMKTHRIQTAVINVDSFVLWSKLVPQLIGYLDERVLTSTQTNAKTGLGLKSAEFWQRFDSEEDSLQVVKDYVRKILIGVLRLEQDDKLKEDVDLQEMGVDSLMYVEIKNALQALLGDRLTLSTSALRECNTLNQISEAILGQIKGSTTEGINESELSYEEINELIRKDSILPEYIGMKSSILPSVPENEIKTVLLTGATGTLGLYVLRELLNTKQVKKVICLIRPKKNVSLEERLKHAIKSRELSEDLILNPKIEIVSGNCAKPNLGVEPDVRETLAKNIDAIFHCSAKVNHVEQYRERDEKIEDVRKTNIYGLKNILEFAYDCKLKHVFHMSSLLSVVRCDYNEVKIAEGWPEIGDYDGVTKVAYANSKFVEEIVMKQAVLERSLPCKVFRLPYLCGNSETGQFPIENDHAMGRYLFVMKSGMMPNNSLPMMTLPVDVVAKTVVKLSFRTDVKPDIYNISHDKPDRDEKFTELAAKFGYKVEIVDFARFCERVLEERDDENGEVNYHPVLKDLYKNEDALRASFFTLNEAFKDWIDLMEKGGEFFKSRKLEKLLPDFYPVKESTLQYLERDLLYAKQQGWF